jgi:hypothetical protein
MSTESAPQQEFSSPNGLPDVSMGMMDENMVVNMDLGISFDDLFGNNATFRPNNGASNDDWTQWMNANV